MHLKPIGLCEANLDFDVILMSFKEPGKILLPDKEIGVHSCYQVFGRFLAWIPDVVNRSLSAMSRD